MDEIFKLNDALHDAELILNQTIDNMDKIASLIPMSTSCLCSHFVISHQNIESRRTMLKSMMTYTCDVRLMKIYKVTIHTHTG